MAQKKDRSRFSIKFRENDPAHERTICILESQGQRNIAPFLVNAVLHYVQCKETPDISHMLVEKPQVSSISREVIEDIVKGILKQQRLIKSEVKGEVKVNTEIETSSEEKKNLNVVEDNPIENILPQNLADEEMRAMITRTLSTFRRN